MKETKFLELGHKYDIEVTKTNLPKSRYERKYGGLHSAQAAGYWRGLNIGNGYKARLRDRETNKIIARKIS